MTFWSELKRCNVFKVGAAYLIVAWLIAQVVEVINEPLEQPDWFDTAVLVFLGAAFPVALLFAWAYELTPAGLKRTSDVPPEKSITQSTGQRLNYVVTGLLIGAVAGSGALWLLTRDSDAGWLTEQAIPAIERYVDLGDWGTA